MKDAEIIPELIDSHCHLEMEAFDPDREEVIARAPGPVVTVGSDIESSRRAVELARRHAGVYCTVGVHPHDARDFTGETYGELLVLTRKEKVVAVGETGLDYHYDNSPRDAQRRVMKRHLELSLQAGLPAVVHSREADRDTLEILKGSGVTRGVLHCFSGDIAMAEEAMAMGLYISIAGPVTFKNAKGLKEVAARVPDDYLLIETDAPYLTPHPLRGRRNEPAYVIHTARAVAALRDVSLEDVARITTLNARRLFGIGGGGGGGAESEGRIAYKIRDSLYLNITNRCTNRCSFCVRFQKDYVKGHNLRLAAEPTAAELALAIGDPKDFKEVVFCGYGEPLLRLDVLKEVAAQVKQRGGRVRINTNGHASLIHKRDILPELSGLVDSVSVSLGAQDAETYERLCGPSFEGAYEAVLGFIKEAKKHIPEVGVTVVEAQGVDVRRCREIARELGVGFRARKLDVTG